MTCSPSAAIGPVPPGQPEAEAMFTVGTTGEKGLGSCGYDPVDWTGRRIARSPQPASAASAEKGNQKGGQSAHGRLSQSSASAVSGGCRRRRRTRRVSASVTSSRQPLGCVQRLAGDRDPAGQDEGEAAERVDILLDRAEPRVDRLGDILKFGAGIGLPAAVLDPDQQAGQFLVMLVLDLADDLLDHVLDGEQPFGAAELVDDDGEMGALGAHPGEQVEHAHATRARRAGCASACGYPRAPGRRRSAPRTRP